MSSLLIDLVIWALLAVGAGFGFIGLFGLFLFPDTRSRMYTSVRATMIGFAVVALAVFIYGLNALQTFGNALYLTLLQHLIVLVIIVVLGNYVLSRIILEKIGAPAGTRSLREKKLNGRNNK
ncbi:MAG: monovalent cation/H(+) antiporter subunit G [Methanoregula sp.]|nr:monovalent cation/H(+) antiporter subunit G [Methanoregula sp.]